MDISTLVEMRKRRPDSDTIMDMKFSADGMSCLMRLYMSFGERLFESKLLATLVIECRDWSANKERVFRVHIPTDLWSSDEWLHMIARDIESIRLCGDFPLKGLLAGKAKARNEASVKIIDECRSQELLRELEEYGFSLVGKFEVVNGLPQITFSLLYEEEEVSIIVLDGWSGQIFFDNFGRIQKYQSAVDFHKVARGQMTACIEIMTTTV